ncbi:FG-GAP repeat domain-containing protein [Polyangium jinanense]|uniref:VCBS repeat-containing protein n=1 Tax=Polyangium jinanense TaxID=2829994 RepID=A0A9X3XE37_9BACT|nr:VCBS repeat-containing protein [Polyangium jinanense]MDC3962713.1 VCBS repeat-containing protein [Polyangium jinanense]MDC3986973.1 VCBS repeat-containing protein [Polyangium jinanense]
MRRDTIAGLVVIALGGAGCGETRHDDGSDEGPPRSDRGGIGVAELALVPGPVTIDARRSLAVTEVAITSRFTLQAVLDALAAQSGVPGVTGLSLFEQLWDTQNPKPGTTSGPHCDDQITNKQTSLNGFSYPCRTTEGGQASAPATEITHYTAIGLFNRFDLAPANGAHCGEYRVIFARTSGGGRNLVNFEAVLPNPRPEIGLEGCRPVANFWRDLSSNSNVASRAALLHDFYFDGLPGVSPVIHVDNYGNTGLRRPTGQVRTNQFMQGPWSLREFALQKSCPAAGCALKFVPVTDKVNPFGALFGPNSIEPRRQAFQDHFVSQLESLAVPDINLFVYQVPDIFNAGDSVSQAPSANDYTAQFGGGGAFGTAIQAKLLALGSNLTPTQIVARAEALSCGGCHQLSNGTNLGGGLTWPSSLGFVHVSEFQEAGPEGNRFPISPALTTVFLPHRKVVFEDFLNRPTSPADFDDDRRAEIVVFRPGNRTMNVLRSSGGFESATFRTIGQVGDQGLGGADFDGDGRADMTAFRPSDRTFTILTSSSDWQNAITRKLGASGVMALAGADFDGDGKADISIWDPATANFSVLTSATSWQSMLQRKWGINGDVPLAGADYDGDRKADFVIFRPGNRTMNVLTSSSNWQSAIQGIVGNVGDVAVPGADYDGDGQADMAVFRPSDGTWTIRTSTSNWQSSLVKIWGASTDTPLAGADLDGDGKAELLFFRPSDGTWNALTSSSGWSSSFQRKWGVSGDVPLTR